MNLICASMPTIIGIIVLALFVIIVSVLYIIKTKKPKKEIKKEEKELSSETKTDNEKENIKEEITETVSNSEEKKECSQEKDFNSMTKKELLEYCSANNIQAKEKMTKSVIIDLINNAEKEEN